MAEELVAQLRLDVSQFTAGLLAATNAAQTFAQTITQQLSQATQAFQNLGRAQTIHVHQQATVEQLAARESLERLQAANRDRHELLKQRGRQEIEELRSTHRTEIELLRQKGREHMAELRRIDGEARAAAQGTQNILKQVFAVAGGLGVATSLTAIVTGLRHIATESVQVAIKMQSMEASFKAITGSAAGANKELTFLRTTADRIGVDFLATAQSFKSLEAAAKNTALEGQGARTVFTAMVEASRVLGLTTDQTKLSLLALEQMMSKGKVTSEELRRQLGDHLPGAFGIAARAMGVTTAELDRMLRAGELISEDFLPKFAAQLRKELGPGLADSAKTAQATFARLGNEVQALAVNTGNAVLTLLQPVASFVAKTLADLRQLRDSVQATKDQVTQEALTGKPVVGGADAFEMPRGMTAAETKRIRDLQDMLVDQRNRIAEAERAAGPGFFAAMREKNLALLKAQHTASEQELKDIVMTTRAREADKQAIEQEFDASVSLATQQQTAGKAYKKTVEETVATEERRRTELEKTLRVEALFPSTYKRNQEELKLLTKAQDDLKEKIRAKPALAEDTQIKAQITRLDEQTAAVLKRIEAEKEAQKAGRQTANGDEANARKALAAMKERERQAEAAERADAAFARDEIARLADLEQAQERANRERLEAEAAISLKLIEMYEGRFAAEREQLQRAVEAMRQKGVDEIQLAQLTEATLADIARRETDAAVRELEQQNRENTRLAKEAAQPWKELANQLEGVLSSAFEGLLNGTFDIFEAIKRAFIKMLADMAAYAFTHQLIIPALMTMAGGAAAFGGTGTALTGQGGDASGTGLVGQAAGTANMARMFGGNAVINRALATQVPLGFRSTMAPAGMVGPTMANGSFYTTAQPVTASVGTLAGAAGAGVGTGFMLSQLNKMMGLHGTGSSVLAGAGGGALAGTMILPGIGTAIGAIVGAIGGLIAGMLSGKKLDPKWDIQRVAGGRVGFDDTRGLNLAEGFEIQKSAFRDVGKFPLDPFVRDLNSSVNKLFTSAISGFQSASPEIQKQLVDPLNAIAAQVRHDIEATSFQGKTWAEDMKKFFGTTLPETVTSLLVPLQEAVAKIEPVIKAWQTLIDKLEADLQTLTDQQTQFDAAMTGQIMAIQMGLFSPGQQWQHGQNQMQDLQRQFAQSQPADQIQLAGVISELAQQLFAAAKGSFTYNPSAAQGLAQARNTPQQQLDTSRATFAYLLEQFNKGDVQTMTTLAPELKTMAENILSLADSIDQAAQQEAVAAQAALVQAQEAVAQAQANAAEAILNAQEALTQAQDTAAKATLQAQEAVVNAQDNAAQATARAQEAVSSAQERADRATTQAQEAIVNAQAQASQATEQAQNQVTQALASESRAIEAIAAVAQQAYATGLQQRLSAVATPIGGINPGAIRGLQQGLYGPAEQFVANRSRLAGLMQEFRGGDSATRQRLAPEIEQLASATLQLARGQDVLGQDAQLVRDTQTAMIQALTETQSTLIGMEQARQAQEALLIEEQRQFQAQQAAQEAAQLQAQLDAATQARTDAQTQLTATIANGVQQVALAQAQLGATQQAGATEVALAQAELVTTIATGAATVAAAQAELAATVQNGAAAVAFAQAQLLTTQQTSAAEVATAQAQLASAQQAATVATSYAQATLEAFYMLQNNLITTITDTQTVTQAALIAYQAQLAGQLQSNQATSDAGFSTLKNALQQQLAMANHEVEILTHSLSNLGSVDGAVNASLAQLNAMNIRLGNPLQTNSTMDPGTIVQTGLLGGINQLAQSQLGELMSINERVGRIYMVPGAAWHGGEDGGGSSESAQHGAYYVPQTMRYLLHQGERVLTAHEAQSSGETTININISGGGVGREGAEAAADAIIKELEKRGSRLGTTRVQVSRR